MASLMNNAKLFFEISPRCIGINDFRTAGPCLGNELRKDFGNVIRLHRITVSDQKGRPIDPQRQAILRKLAGIHIVEKGDG